MALPRRPRARARPADRAVRSPQVSFRPIRLEEYDDTIQFFTEKGSFVVPIKAYIPRISSRVPESLDFGFCPCRETGTKTFHVVNDGEIPIEFKWTCNSPFTLSPRSGTVAAGSTATITARFQPTDACVYVAHCVCVVPGHTSHTMKLGGIGKYPFVAASLEMVDFAHVPTGASETKVNPTPTPTPNPNPNPNPTPTPTPTPTPNPNPNQHPEPQKVSGLDEILVGDIGRCREM